MTRYFISRASHNEVVEILKAEILELKAERKRTLDYILERSAGRGLFDEVTRPIPIQAVTSSSYFGKPVNEDDPFEEARGRKHPRQALREVQTAVNREADLLTEAQRVILDTVKEGQQAATA